MRADAKHCPGCGAELPANTPEGVCPRCALGGSMTVDGAGPADVDATTAPAATDADRAPSRRRAALSQPTRPRAGRLRIRPRPRPSPTPPATGPPTPAS